MSEEITPRAMTERQVSAMAERVKEAKLHGVDMESFTPWDSDWHGTFGDETRPGRGRDFNGVWCDGEKLVQMSLDVYGNGYLAVADVNWTHGGEDCECEICLDEQDDEE